MKNGISAFGIPAAAFGALALVGVGCSSEQTQATNTWKDPSYVAGPMKNIVVVGARMADTDRRTLEDSFVKALAAHGTHATPSYEVLPTPFPGKEAARMDLLQGGYDGVLVATLKGVNEAATVYSSGPGFWDGFYGTGWAEPVVVTTPVVKFETSLWSPRAEGKMVWSTITRSEGPSTGKDFTSSLTKKVVPLMADAGVIPPAGGEPISTAPHPAQPLQSMQ